MRRRSKALVTSVLVAAAVVLPAAEARAASGDLDTSFDTDGIAQINVFKYPQGTGLAVQPDGSIVIGVGSPWANVFGAMRLLPDGTPDTTFSGNGRVQIDLPGPTSATDLLLQADGKIVVAGFAEKRMVVARFAGDGTLDGTVETFIEMVFNHPTLGETFKYAAYDALAKLGPA
jgi:uncharacterized delta-60 repeat protein